VVPVKLQAISKKIVNRRQATALDRENNAVQVRTIVKVGNPSDPLKVSSSKYLLSHWLRVKTEK
jgi:hypothetical protein